MLNKSISSTSLISYKNKTKKRLGRGHGSNSGFTCGRGSKGQKCRGKVNPLFEGGQTKIYIRLPKRGFTSHTNKNIYSICLSKFVYYVNEINNNVLFNDFSKFYKIKHRYTFVKVIYNQLNIEILSTFSFDNKFSFSNHVKKILNI